MRNLISRVAGLLIGIAISLTAANVAAQSGTVSGNIECQAPGYKVDWSVTWTEEPDGYKIMGCYMPDYSYQSAEVFYLPGPGYNATSDGSEIKEHVDQYENGNQLYGVWVWFEWGSSSYVEEWDMWFWNCSGCTDPCFLPRPGSCFAAGTPLLTPDGSKPIEQFKACDWILSSPEDDPDAPSIARRVQEVIRTHGHLVDITVSGRVVRATREHPFYVKGKGWTSVASLAVGDLLRGGDDRWMPVQSIVDAGKAPVYNVRVEEHNTYFVGTRDWEFSLWVYGACNKPTMLEQLAQSKSTRQFVPRGRLRSLK